MSTSKRNRPRGGGRSHQSQTAQTSRASRSRSAPQPSGKMRAIASLPLKQSAPFVNRVSVHVHHRRVLKISPDAVINRHGPQASVGRSENAARSLCCPLTAMPRHRSHPESCRCRPQSVARQSVRSPSASTAHPSLSSQVGARQRANSFSLLATLRRDRRHRRALGSRCLAWRTASGRAPRVARQSPRSPSPARWRHERGPRMTGASTAPRPRSATTTTNGHRVNGTMPDDHESWLEPDWSVLDDRRGYLPVFPVEVLPPPWQHWLGRASRGAGVTPDHVMVPLLSIASSLVGAARRVRASSSWLEPLSMWTAVVGFSVAGRHPASR